METGFWQVVETNLPLVTAIGIWTGVVIAWLLYIARHDLPVPSVSPRHQRVDLPCAIEFELDSGTESRWLVRSACIRRMRRPCLAERGRMVGEGEVQGFIPGLLGNGNSTSTRPLAAA